MYTNPHRHHSSSFKAPSRNANSYELGTNRSRSNFDDICDETWPLDEVINKIELKSDSEEEHNDQQYNMESNIWRSGPQLVSNTFNSKRDMNRIAGNGTLLSSFHQGSKTWKDTSISHRKYKTKKQENPYEKTNFLNYDVNNNYLDIDVNIDETSNFSDDYSPTLRDVGIQCNLKKFKDSFPIESRLIKKKPPIKVIKSSNNGVVSTFSDVPKLSLPNSQRDFNFENSKSNDVIYSQVDKSHKNHGNINIVYKQPLNDNFNTNRSFNMPFNKYDVKTKEFGFNINNPNFPTISLPNPNESLSKKNRNDKEILEETISISNSSTDESLRIPITKQNDNFSMTSKSSSNYRKESPLRYSFYDNNFTTTATTTKNKESQRKIKKNKNYENDENVLLENNSLRLKSSKSPYTERLHKSNADLREQFLRDETRGGLAAAYKNRQQKNQNRQRTLSLNRMNVMVKEEENANQYQLPSRYLSQNHLSSRLSDLGNPRNASRLTLQHERDPIVMYIPPVNHPRTNEQSPKLTSILRNNSTKSNVTLQSKTKKLKQPKSQSKINLKEINKEKSAEKKSDLNRRYSMPKDTKFNWFSKLKLKSK